MKTKMIGILLLGVVCGLTACAEQPEEKKGSEKVEKVIVAGGCFWGVEAILQDVDGVIETTVGYTGGHTKNPTYKEVCHKQTGHAEAVEVVFDPAKISYEKLLDVFWRLHDPTTLNRQGPDVGSQYRSAVFYLNDEQKLAAEKVKQEAQKDWDKPIVTEITKATIFYPAEDYHQNYFKKNGGHGCHFLRD